MKILGLSHHQSGCGFHRVVLPMAFMNGIKGFVTNIPVYEKLEEGWDIILYNRKSVLDKDWEEVKKQMGSKVVMDMDDDWILPANHINYDTYVEYKPVIENNLRMADLVTCTNEILAERIYPFNNNVKIFPNALPYGEHQFTLDKEEDERVRIFWCGGATHEHDLKILKYPFRRLIDFSSKIKMVLGGYTDTDPVSKIIWDRMFNSFTSNGQLPWSRIGGLNPTEYMNLYNYADIMVVPLEESPWHACKSNLKLLEAACKKIPVVVSKVNPYALDTDAPVFWVEHQSDWYKHLKFLINNKNARLDYGEKIYEWANKKYHLKNINIGRKSTFEDLIKA